MPNIVAMVTLFWSIHSFHLFIHLFICHKGYKREKKMKKKKSYCLQSHGEEAQKKPAGL